MQRHFQYDYAIISIKDFSQAQFSHVVPVYNDADVVVDYEKHSGRLQNDAIDGILWIHAESITSSLADYMQFEAKRGLLATITEDQLKEMLTPVLSADNGKMPF